MTNGYRAQKQAQTNLSITPMAKGVHQAPGTGTIAFPGEKKKCSSSVLSSPQKENMCLHPHIHELCNCGQKTNCKHFRNHCGINFINSRVFFFFFNQDTHVTEINVCLLSASFSNHDLYPEQCFPREMCAMLEMT